MKTRYLLQATCYDSRGRKLSTGTNSYTRTHPMMAYFSKLSGEPAKIYLHAEVSALLKCKTQIPYSLHVRRIDSSGNLKLAKPCLTCQEAMRAFGVRFCFYSTNEGTIERLEL